MDVHAERAAFSRRLNSALERFDPPGRTGVAWLAREFNQRYGGRAISVHAARKWLMGDAIPTHDKLVTLARWLKVSPEWLLFGEGEVRTARQDAATYDTPDGALCRDIQTLSVAHRRIVADLVAGLLRLESGAAAEPARTGGRGLKRSRPRGGS